jgi:SAM-dependent methyltransferase
MGVLRDKAKRYASAFDGAQRLADETVRIRKADKIRAVLRDEGMLPDRSRKILDIGCSFGLILKHLVSDAGFGVGTDIDEAAMRVRVEKIAYVSADGEYLPFRSNSFDIVICNHVYEHTDNPQRMISEIERILTPKGVCYFAGPNKFDIVEPHYDLPFLSWLPRSLADFYLRLTGKGERYTETPYSYSALMRLLGGFEITDYTAKILADPVRYSAADMLPPGSFKQFLARMVFKLVPFIFPGFVFILRKLT